MSLDQTIITKLDELGLTLPGAPAPAGNYLPWRMHGNLLFLSGVLCIQEGKMTHTGSVGIEQTIETAQQGARICVLNALAAIRAALGSFDRIDQIQLLNGFVLAPAGFADSPLVINGASDLLVELLGDRGRHARAAVAVAGLPKNSTVEIQINLSFQGN